MATQKKAASKSRSKKQQATKKRSSTRKSAPKKETTKTPQRRAKVDDRYFMRNVKEVPVAFRLTRQEDTKRRTELKPRGNRGDMQVLLKEDLTDPRVDAALNDGLIEIITGTEAAKVMHGQVTNQKRVHPAIASLRSETGKEYAEGAIQLMPEFNSQGITVAHTEDGQILFEKGPKGGIKRDPIISDGFAAAREEAAANAEISVPKGEELANVRDQAARDARKRGIQGPAAGLGDLKVSVNPVQKT